MVTIQLKADNSVDIPPEEIEFHPTSYCDSMGRVFFWRGELYRGITPDYVSFYQKMFEDGTITKLVQNRYLVQTEITDLHFEGYPLVFKHATVPFVSYASEWCPQMLKDAGAFILDLMEELARHNLTLADASTFDLLYDGTQPLLVDLTTIVPADFDLDRSWKFFRDDFQSYFLEPLSLMAQGYGNLSRWLLSEYDHDVIEEFAVLMGYSRIVRTGGRSRNMANGYISKIREKIRSAFRLLSTSDPEPHGLEIVEQMRRDLEQIPLLQISEGYKQYSDASLLPAESWTGRQKSIHRVLSDLKPSSVIDLGCGDGLFALLAASLGSLVVALDLDELSIAECYRQAKTGGLLVLPLVMNLRNPSPGMGVGNKVLPSAFERLSCEFGLALSIVHQLAIEQYLTLEQIADTFANFITKWLLVEFSPREEIQSNYAGQEIPEWYRLERFIAVLEKRFNSVESLPSGGNSRLLLCRK